MSATVAPQQLGAPVATTATTRDARRTGGGRRRITTWVLSALSVLLFLFFVFPVYWMVNTSLQPDRKSTRQNSSHRSISRMPSSA